MQNVGKLDRIIRIILGVVLLSLVFILKGDARYLGLLGAVPLFTGLAEYCPLYKLLGISTRRNKEE